MVRRLSTPNLITLEPATIVPLPIAYGGTGATSALDALKNLHAISLNEKGAPNGVATLDADGIVPLNQLPPTSVDSVTLSGSATKLLQYVTCANNRLYATGYLTSLSAGTKDTLAVCTPTALNLALAPLPSTNLSTLSFTSPTYKVNAANLSYATKNYASYTTSLTPTSLKYPSVDVVMPVSTSLLC